jgi:shikimate dehydrogenase
VPGQQGPVLSDAPPDAGGTHPYRCAVWGHPVSHSLSPVLHRAAYAALGLPGWGYERRDVDVDGFDAALAGLDASWRGLSLTMPLKEVALAAAETVGGTARATGAANTLVRIGDGSGVDGRWAAENTDVVGIVRALADAGAREVTDAVVVGSGATARSAVAALATMGVRRVTLMVRAQPRPETVEQARRSGLTVDVVTLGDWRRADVVVSTVPPPAVGGLDRLPPAGGSGTVLLDVVYGGGRTPLEDAAAAAGWSVAPGVDMLLHQATEQVRLMTGSEAPVEAMREALRAELARRG